MAHDGKDWQGLNDEPREVASLIMWQKWMYSSNELPNMLMIYINNSFNLARNWYARIFVHGHYLFRVANSFPRAKLDKNCELRGTDNVQGRISEHIFAPNGDCCLYYPSYLFSSNLFRIFPSFSRGILGHVTCLDQSRASKKIWWIIT